MTQNDHNNRPKLRGFPMLVVLACGIIVVLIGIYLTFSGGRIHGEAYPGKSGGRNGPIDLSGIGVIVIGLLVCSFPVYAFYKKDVEE